MTKETDMNRQAVGEVRRGEWINESITEAIEA